MTFNTQHFARQLVGSNCLIDKAMVPPMRPQFAVHHMHTSTSARAVGLPSLGNEGVSFRSSRWTQGGAESGMSVFDMKGAMEALQKGPDEASTKRAHPAQLAHAARIARAQQAGLTFYGFKVFPDLTPGRAFMWGTVLAVYAVGAGSYAVARAAGVTSVGDIREKMQAAFAPYKEALQGAAAATRGGLQPAARPAFLDAWADVGASVAATLRDRPAALLRDDAPHELKH